jgi:hypothetical protein
MNAQEIQKTVVQLIVLNLRALKTSGLSLSGNVVLFVVLMSAALAVADRSIILTVAARHVPSVTIAKLIILVYSPFAVREHAATEKYGGVGPNVHQNVEFKPLSSARLYAYTAVSVLGVRS